MSTASKLGLAVCAVIGGFAVIQFADLIFPGTFSGAAYIEFLIGAGIGAGLRYLYIAFLRPVNGAGEQEP